MESWHMLSALMLSSMSSHLNNFLYRGCCTHKCIDGVGYSWTCCTTVWCVCVVQNRTGFNLLAQLCAQHWSVCHSSAMLRVAQNHDVMYRLRLSLRWVMWSRWYVCEMMSTAWNREQWRDFVKPVTFFRNCGKLNVKYVIGTWKMQSSTKLCKNSKELVKTLTGDMGQKQANRICMACWGEPNKTFRQQDLRYWLVSGYVPSLWYFDDNRLLVPRNICHGWVGCNSERRQHGTIINKSLFNMVISHTW
jgi:hypothetical protein